MLNGRFQIFLRHRQNVQDGINVIVQCNPITGFAEYVPGSEDATWYDYTDYIEGVEKLALTWDKVNTGDSSSVQTNQDGSNYDKGISSDLMFFDAAFEYIRDWLISNECQILNAIEVKIVDLIAGGTYRLFEIKADNIEYAPVDEPCQFHIKLREQDGVWHCIHKTFIFDNWQNWFEESAVKEHPCFLTCIEPRPRLIQSVRMALMLFYHSNPVINIFDGNERDDTRRILNANRFVDSPLVRTYIENVAGKCGLATDTIFDEGEEWENVCLFYPQAGYMHESDADAVASPSLSYHFDNRWLITIAELFDKMKPVFAAEWYVTPNNTIVFRYTKDLINLAPIYDFTLPESVAIYDLRYTFNGDKKPAYGRYQYTDDGSDLASQEMSTLYNDIIDYDGPANNPMLEGERIKHNEFAPTGFVRDGRAKDYMALLINDGKVGALILLGIITVVTAALIAGVLTVATGGILGGFLAVWGISIAAKANSLENEFVDDPTYTGAVRLTSEQVLTPRLILWDGVSLERAKAVSTVLLPEPNLYYNPDAIPYNVKNKIAEDNPSLHVYNYPMYFDGDFEGNLFDQYHDIIDNPLKSLETHQDAKWNVDLCEDMLNLFGVFEGQYIVIGKVVKLETRNNYDIFVRLGNINVDYNDNVINLKGKVIRRASEPPEPPVTCDTFEINAKCLVINGFYININ